MNVTDFVMKFLAGGAGSYQTYSIVDNPHRSLLRNEIPIVRTVPTAAGNAYWIPVIIQADAPCERTLSIFLHAAIDRDYVGVRRAAPRGLRIDTFTFDTEARCIDFGRRPGVIVGPSPARDIALDTLPSIYNLGGYDPRRFRGAFPPRRDLIQIDHEHDTIVNPEQFWPYPTLQRRHTSVTHGGRLLPSNIRLYSVLISPIGLETERWWFVRTPSGWQRCGTHHPEIEAWQRRAALLDIITGDNA